MPSGHREGAVTREEVHGQYRQTLAWRAQGLSIDDIGHRHHMAFVDALRHFYDALWWYQHAPVLTADLPIEVLDCSARTRTRLRRAGLRTVGAVAAASDHALSHTSGIGPTPLTRLRADLAARYVHEQEP